MPVFFLDIRYAFRTLLKNPAFTITALVSLALGIGVNTAIFGLVNALFLRPLPVRDPDRLISVYQRSAQAGKSLSSMGYPDYEYYRDHNQVFSGLLGYTRVPVNLGLNESVQRASAEVVSGNYFAVLDIGAVAGRTFMPGQDDRSGAAPTAVLSHALWMKRFDGDAAVVGRNIVINGGQFTVIGIAPANFAGIVLDIGEAPDVWLTLATAGATIGKISFENRNSHSLLVTGRLKPGIGVEQARANITALHANIEKGDPEAKSGYVPQLFSLQQARIWPDSRGPAVTFMAVLGGVAGLTLLVACFNVAILLLSRTTQREQEIVFRLAVGAGRGRLVRQLLVEGTLLSALGCAAALLVANWTSVFLGAFAHSFQIPMALELSVDGRVLAFAAAVSLLTGAFFGLAPVFEASRFGLNSSLKGGTRSLVGGSGMRNGFLIGQLVVCTVLLTCAALFIRTVANAQAADPIFKAGNALLLKLDLHSAGYSEGRTGQFYREALDRVRALPGVVSAAFVGTLPLAGRRGAADISVPMADGASAARTANVNLNVVSPAYFRTAGLALLRGRDFAERDDEKAARVAVVNEEMARRFWPGQEPVGKNFRLRSGMPVQVIGVVRDGRMRNLREDLRPCFYVPIYQQYQNIFHLEVKTAGNPVKQIAAVRGQLQAIARGLPLEFTTLEDHLDAALAKERMAMQLTSALALLALILAAVGIYGVISLSVSQKTREIGLRMALGARAGEVLRMVLRRGALITGAGLAIGFACACLLGRLIGSFLFGITAWDLGTYAKVALLIGVVTMAACYFPARRAASLEPMDALRHE
jgi:predicted permease